MIEKLISGEKDHQAQIKEEQVGKEKQKQKQVGITTTPSLFISRKTKLSLTELKKASKLSLRIPKEHPNFVAVMRHLNVSEQPLLVSQANYDHSSICFNQFINNFVLRPSLPVSGKPIFAKIFHKLLSKPQPEQKDGW